MNALNLAVVDWSRSRRADLTEVPSAMTVGEFMPEIREAMELARDTPYALIYEGTKLARNLTLAEAGVQEGAEMVIAPEVSAGR